MAGPDFLILGCQKGGTTTLYDLLTQHSRVQPAAAKEVHFFSLHHQRGWDWYAQQFPKAGDGITGEATPYYLFHPLAAARIALQCPKARLIALLRDPVQRSLSQYFHARRLGLEPLELEAALAAEAQRLKGAEAVLARGERHLSHQEHSYLNRSRYGPQLERYAALFPTNQLLLLRSETFFSDPAGTAALAWRFLGLEPEPLGPVQAANRGHGEAAAIPASVRVHLEKELAGERTVMEQWLKRLGPHAQFA
jgi:hypothetical protein